MTKRVTYSTVEDLENILAVRETLGIERVCIAISRCAYAPYNGNYYVWDYANRDPSTWIQKYLDSCKEFKCKIFYIVHVNFTNLPEYYKYKGSYVFEGCNNLAHSGYVEIKRFRIIDDPEAWIE